MKWQVLWVMFFVGCINKATNLGATPTTVGVNAGIVFVDRSDYICWPIEKLGPINQGDEIISINTSCECVNASVIQYKKNEAENATAILFSFFPTQEALDRPSNLSVIVTGTTRSGKQLQFALNFLHTSQVNDPNQ